MALTGKIKKILSILIRPILKKNLHALKVSLIAFQLGIIFLISYFSQKNYIQGI